LKKYAYFLFIIAFICFSKVFAQTNKITIYATLFPDSNEIKIKQETTFYNKSDSILNEVYFHNWPNSYKDKQTPLAKRFIENYSKTFHFTNEKHRGNTTINGISLNFDVATFEITDENPDFLKVNLNDPLKPKDSVKISATYLVKIPNDKFTKYGASEFEYNLRYWYLAPAIYDTKWRLYNNLDIDDLYIDYTDYNISFKVPKEYEINTDLKASYFIKDSIKNYGLSGKKRLDIALNISKNSYYKNYFFDDISISTDILYNS